MRTKEKIVLGDPIMLSFISTLSGNRNGATVVEYTLIAALIAVAAIVAMVTVGGKITNVLSNAANVMG